MDNQEELEEIDLELDEEDYNFLLEMSEDLSITPSQLVSRILKDYIDMLEFGDVNVEEKVLEASIDNE